MYIRLFTLDIFVDGENIELPSDNANELVTVAEVAMTIHPLANIMIRKAGGRLFKICGACRSPGNTCPTGCRCHFDPIPPNYCEGNCC